MGWSRILLVDSHDSSRQLLARLLRMSGFEVVAARTAEQAQALAEVTRFDWLISEISPPGLPEFALMRSLQDSHGTRGIVITAHDVHCARGWHRAGFRHVLRKPLEFDRLLAKLRRHRNITRAARTSREASVAVPADSRFVRRLPGMALPTATLN